MSPLCLFSQDNLGHNFTTSDTLAKIGIEHGPASKVMSKLHEHSVLTFHKILTSRRVLEREKSDKTGHIRLRFKIFRFP